MARPRPAACPFGRRGHSSLAAARRLALLLVSLGGTTAPARGQSAAATPRVHVDAASAVVSQPQGSARLVASVGGGVAVARRSFAWSADATGTLAADSAGAVQGTTRLAFAPWRAVRTDLDVAFLRAGGGVHARSLQGEQQLRLGAWHWALHAGASRSAREGLGFAATRLGTSLSVARGGWQLRGRADRARTNDFRLMEASGITLRRLAAGYALDDVMGEVTYAPGRFTLALQQQWRRGREATTGSTRGTALVGSASLTPQLLLVGYVGTQLADVLRAVPQARAVGVSMRWWLPGRASAATAPGIPTASQIVHRGEITLERTPGRSVLTLRIEAPAGAQVELAGSFNDWTPIALPHDGAQFVYRLPLATGTHIVAVRINGGLWRAPVGLVAVADDFGGSGGRVTVP